MKSRPAAIQRPNSPQMADKPKHRRGFSAIFGPKPAPVLDFDIRIYSEKAGSFFRTATFFSVT